MTSPIQVANQGITMSQACRWAGFEAEGGRKARCPFGEINHDDGGIEAAFRVYEDTNSAHCFACAKSWTPVSLLADFWDCSRTEAAEKMLEMADLALPGWRERWGALQHPAVPDREALAEALKQWCLRMRGESWKTEQFDQKFADPLAACLGVLPLVETGGQADEWLDGCKMILGPLLKEGNCD